MNYQNENEMNAVIGEIKNNHFLKKLKEKTDNNLKQVEYIIRML